MDFIKIIFFSCPGKDEWHQMNEWLQMKGKWGKNGLEGHIYKRRT